MSSQGVQYRHVFPSTVGPRPSTWMNSANFRSCVGQLHLGHLLGRTSVYGLTRNRSRGGSLPIRVSAMSPFLPSTLGRLDGPADRAGSLTAVAREQRQHGAH